jgi:Fe-S-cluster containining protein
MSDTSWFDAGLRFGCKGCGACCKTHGDYAYVYLSDRDVSAVSAYLHMNPVDFLEAYCTRDETGATHLAETRGDCVFLDATNRCAIYPVHPKQCATWPFWSENLNELTWHVTVMSCCKGIGTGRRYSREEALAIARKRDEWYAPNGHKLREFR